MRTTGIWALALTTLIGSQSAIAADLPGKGIAVQPVQSTISEETFQTLLVSKALEKLGYDVKEPREVDYNVAYTSIASGDATFIAVNWDPLHADQYKAAGGDAKFYREGVYVNGAAQGYLIDKKTAEQYHITNVEQLKDPKIAKLFDTNGDGKADLTGCTPGWGCEAVINMLEDAFSYANQLGARQGAGAVYLNAHHPDILRFLDTKRENADEKIRIKTLSLGVVIPDITFELAKNNEEMYLFSPYDVERVYGTPLSEISVSEKYREMVDDKRIRKSRINAREFFQVLAEIQFESGYPYVMFEDTVNRENPIAGRINMSNLCSEILQVNRASTYHEDLSYDRIGKDISCNLGSLNIAKTMDAPDFGKAIETAIRALTAVADMSDIRSVPSIAEGNRSARAIGLGQMNLHGYLARERIFYGSEEGIDFTNLYFYTVAYHAIRASNRLAIERGGAFDGFEHSRYASGEYFDKYTERDWLPQTERVRELFAAAGIAIPGRDEWRALRQSVMMHGLYNQNLQAVPPTGSISYINNATSSIHPIVSRIEIRKEGKIGRVYYPAPYMTNDNLAYYQDAYEIGPEKIIDTYAAATQHVDQGLSLTLFFRDTATTRDINRAQIYAWRKGIKTIYYIRLRQMALEGTEVQGCVSCAL